MALRARKVSGAFEKRAPGPVIEISVFATGISVTDMNTGFNSGNVPGGKYLDTIASLSQLSGQSGLIFAFYVFPL